MSSTSPPPPPPPKKAKLDENADFTLPTESIATTNNPPIEEPYLESDVSSNVTLEEQSARKRPPQATCAVADCPPNPPFPMHKFPNPMKPENKERIAKWIAFCKRKDKSFNVATARVCSLHFSANCYQKGVVRKILKSDAVPDKNPPKNVSSAVKNYRASSRFNVQLQPKKKVLTATISAPPSPEPIAKSIVEPILESILESAVEPLAAPKVWTDSGVASFDQQRSQDMKKMDNELKTPDEINVQEKLPNPPKPKTNPPSVSKTKR